MKPKAILFYNENKAGVDCMDQMVTYYIKWTFAFFCNMLDQMALAAFCICNQVDGLNKKSARVNFLSMLADTLVLPNIGNPTLVWPCNRIFLFYFFCAERWFSMY